VLDKIEIRRKPVSADRAIATVQRHTVRHTRTRLTEQREARVVAAEELYVVVENRSSAILDVLIGSQTKADIA